MLCTVMEACDAASLTGAAQLPATVSSSCLYNTFVFYTFYGPIPPPFFCKCTVPQKCSDSYHSFPPCRHIITIFGSCKKYSHIPQEKNPKIFASKLKITIPTLPLELPRPLPRKTCKRQLPVLSHITPLLFSLGSSQGSSHKQNV